MATQGTGSVYLKVDLKIKKTFCGHPKVLVQFSLDGVFFRSNCGESKWDWFSLFDNIREEKNWRK